MVQLSNYEWKIMNLIWDREPQTIMQLTKALDEDTGWTKHTVITYLKRLEAKGAVRFEQNGRTKYFYAEIKRNEVQMQETDSFLNRVFAGNLGLMINTMIKEEKLTDDEIQELTDLLKNNRKK